MGKGNTLLLADFTKNIPCRQDVHLEYRVITIGCFADEIGIIRFKCSSFSIPKPRKLSQERQEMADFF